MLKATIGSPFFIKILPKNLNLLRDINVKYYHVYFKFVLVILDRA